MDAVKFLPVNEKRRAAVAVYACNVQQPIWLKGSMIRFIGTFLDRGITGEGYRKILGGENAGNQAGSSAAVAAV